MAVRNYRELSGILQKIAERLLSSQELCKVLYYIDSDPLAHPDFDNTKILLGDVVRFTPRVGAHETTKCILVMSLVGGARDGYNKEILVLPIYFYIYIPYTQWVIEGDELRPFLIMSYIDELLDGKRVGGIGTLRSIDFELDSITDEMCCYRMGFTLDLFK